MEFVDSRIGVAVGARATSANLGSILATRDGGANWTEQFACALSIPCTSLSPDRLQVPRLVGVSLVDAERGYAVGRAGTILATTDGGATWRPQTSATAVELQAVSFPTPSQGYAVGEGGTVLTTTDGSNWAAQGSGTEHLLTGVSFSDATHGHIVGAQGTVLATNDGGTTWTAQNSFTTGQLEDVSFTDRLHGHATGLATESVMIATSDGGSTWVHQSVGGTTPLRDVSFTDSDHGFVVGRDFIAVTDDGGATWRQQDSGIQGAPYLHAVSATDANSAHAVGMGGVILVYQGCLRCPSPPLEVKASPGDQSATVSWRSPESDGGSPIRTYTVTAVPGGVTRTVDAPATTAAVTGLTNRTAYRFTVTATNAEGAQATSLLSEPVIPVPRAWDTVSPLQLKRVNHTATVLEGPACLTAPRPAYCGKLIVAGGAAPDASAELYDPATRRWAFTGAMVKARSKHTATLLTDGRLLVVGGENASAAALSEAELYDPVTGKWTATGPLARPRSGHAAVLLPNDKVLVSGAAIGQASASTAEVYDPASGVWTQTSPHLGPGNTLTLLSQPPCGDNCGKVLATSGEATQLYDWRTDTWSPTGSGTMGAQLYDPRTGRWTTTGSGTTGRIPHHAVPLANGKVLTVLAGTIADPLDRDNVDDVPDGAGLIRRDGTRAELYDPVAGTWAPAAPPAMAGGRHKATTLADGRVLLVGHGPIGVSQAAEIYDPTADVWEPTEGPLIGRTDHSVTLLPGGEVLAVGGQGPGSERTVEAFVPGAAPAIPTPQVLGLDRRSGSTRGGTSVGITGVALGGVTEVTFGGAPASFTLESPTRIVAVSPAHPAGAAGVAVSVGNRPSAAHQGALFTYTDFVGAWRTTGSLLRGRFNHTATLLRDGWVLVTGGNGASGELASSAMYDPATGKWSSEDGSPEISMTAPRSRHSATLLRDGRVLVAGGNTASAEVFDPVSRTWQVTGSMNSARTSHRATLLPDGQVLVTGGARSVPVTNDSDPKAAAEVYDPATGQWAPTGPVNAPGLGNSVVLLPNGKVLAAGGGPDGRSAELYDPATNGWSATAFLTSPDGHIAGVLEDGRVVAMSASGAIELYDPLSGTWAYTTARPEGSPPYAASAFLSDGRLLMAGGPFDPSGSDRGSESYDPVVGTWATTSPLVVGRHDHTATLLADGNVLVVGGARDDNSNPLTSAEVFAVGPIRPQIYAVDPPAGPAGGGTVVTISGAGFNDITRVSFGGAPAQVASSSVNTIVAVAPAGSRGTVDVKVVTVAGSSPEHAGARFTYGSGTWRSTTAPPATADSPQAARFLHTATLLDDGHVLVTGGTLNNFNLPNPLESSLVYDPSKASWTATGSLLEARFYHAATLLKDGKVLVSGGLTEDPDVFNPARAPIPAISSAELYDPATGAWRAVAPMKIPRMGHTSTRLRDGRVLVAGGTRTESQRSDLHDVTPTSEIFDPLTNSWSLTDVLTDGRVGHTATLLDDGTVLVVGGMGENPATHEGNIVPSAELFDPDTGSWTDTANLAVGRTSHTASLLPGGRVLVAGGSAGGLGGLSATELYDPVQRTWAPAAPLLTSRGGHTASLLADGTVLVAGGGPTFPAERLPGPLTSAEIYEPAENRWRFTSSMNLPRGMFTATLLGGPDCGGTARSAACGAVLAVGGSSDIQGQGVPPPGSAELYIPNAAPTVTGVVPAIGPSAGGTPVAITGNGFDGALRVTFGGVPADSVTVESSNTILAVSPAHASGPVEVTVANPEGTSATLEPTNHFRYLGTPAAVTGLQAEPVSSSQIKLRFPAAAASDGPSPPPASRYVVKQSNGPILNSDAFAAAATLCGTTCTFSPAAVGQELSLSVADLGPATTYHYAIRAVNEVGTVGPFSGEVAVTTPGAAAKSACAVQSSPAPGQVRYPAGYSLVGLPQGTAVGADGPLYGWFDQGAGGSYQPASLPDAGRGYWSFGFCDRLVTLGTAGPTSLRLPLGAYHASMVGNPSSTAPASVSGHDFAARWDRDANGGAGGYVLSGYRESQTLPVGHGTWVFSYAHTEVKVDATR